MAKTVKTIPATLNPLSAVPLASFRKRRVAGYARVSTGEEDQQTSYQAQVDYFTNYIKSREDWEFISVYTDEGISGTSITKRKGFQQMIADALAGKIDLIVTKSVSRFARNTVDSLSTIRTLKEHGVECYFEKENIYTFDNRGELLISIMSSLSQEEARSISQNVTWGVRKSFSDGKVHLAYSHFLGYDKGEDGNLVINEEEAKIVRRIYSLFLQGMSPYGIANLLNEEGVPSPSKKGKWFKKTVQNILENEKYRGDVLLQKSFTTDFLTHKMKPNHGEVPQYFIEKNHDAIIDPVIHAQVQRELKRRSETRKSSAHIFSGRLKCAQCGSWYGSKTWHSTDKYRHVIWRCNHKYDGEICTTPHVTEDEIKQGFVVAVNTVLDGRQQAISAFEAAKETIFNCDELESKAAAMQDELQIIAQMINSLIHENASTALNQVEYKRRYDKLCDRYEGLQADYSASLKQIEDKKDRLADINDYLSQLTKVEGRVDTFSQELWCGLVDYVEVGDKLTFVFKDGAKVPVNR